MVFHKTKEEPNIQQTNHDIKIKLLQDSIKFEELRHEIKVRHYADSLYFRKLDAMPTDELSEEFHKEFR